MPVGALSISCMYCVPCHADTVRDVRLVLPVQTVDATPSNQLIRQYFPKIIVLCGKTQSEPKQGSVLFESTLANEIGFVDS
jgi:hypothetical protein